MLATGIFDDFAWILNRVYRLGLRDMDIKLRCVYKNNEFLNSTFIKKLMNKNIELSRILKNQNLQNDINVLYSLTIICQLLIVYKNTWILPPFSVRPVNTSVFPT